MRRGFDAAIETKQAACDVLAKHNIEFLEMDGVRRNLKVVRNFCGSVGVAAFYDELIAAAKNRHMPIAAIFDTEDNFAKALGVDEPMRFNRIERLANLVKIRCLISDAKNSSISIPYFETRAIAENPFTPYSVIIFGNEVALINMLDTEPVYIVTRSTMCAKEHLKAFDAKWAGAVPLDLPTVSKALKILHSNE